MSKSTNNTFAKARPLEKPARDRQRIISAHEKGKLATVFTYTRLSGPGWLQSAITLGGGSLAGSLYLGVLAGFSLLWLQPLFMILGIVMLSAIGYVTMSTGQRPFRAINHYVNPVLGWSWALATLAANMVWCLPQFSLANSVLEQNLAPGLYSPEIGLGPTGGKMLIAGSILVITLLITWSYGSGHWGVRLYEMLLKLMVAGIVLCFIWVVYYLSTSEQIAWPEIARGFLPDPRLIFEPAPGFQTVLESIPEQWRGFWRDEIVGRQQDKMAAAAATAVGINMTFLFPYSIIKRGWSKEFRGLQVFDLCTGMFIPFVVATSCVVIAAGAQFHTKEVPGLVKEEAEADQVHAAPTAKEIKEFRDIMAKRLKKEIGTEQYDQLASGEEEFAKLETTLPQQTTVMTAAEKAEQKATWGAARIHQRIEEIPVDERKLAAMLVDRDANRLAQTLAPLGADNTAESGNARSQAADLVFGLGVIGMTMSSITLLMLISGFVICEMFNLSPTGWSFRLACLPAAVGVLGPFVWSKAGFALAVPTSVFGLMLLPIAYVTFFLLMNQRKLLGDEMPQGGKRIVWSLMMALATLVAIASSVYMVWKNVKWNGVYAIGALLALALIVQVYRWIRPPGPLKDES